MTETEKLVEDLGGQVRIGYRTYTFKLIDGWESDKAQSYGEHDMAPGVITLCAHMDGEKAANTMWHEILHAIWQVYHLTDERPPQNQPVSVTEEALTTRMATALTALAQDNPRLLPILNGASNSRREVR